jgi:hypothetical protein
MLGALQLVTGLMFDGATVVVTIGLAGLACAVLW